MNKKAFQLKVNHPLANRSGGMGDPSEQVQIVRGSPCDLSLTNGTMGRDHTGTFNACSRQLKLFCSVKIHVFILKLFCAGIINSDKRP